ncbi:MAG: family 20 glycosylhydrolase [Promethearchaeota archaeon]
MPKPKQLDNFSTAEHFTLHDRLKIFVNKAKIQDHILDFFAFFWKNFKLNLKITPINDRDYRESFDNGFFMYISDGTLPDDFESTFTEKLSACPAEGYHLVITTDYMYIISKTVRGFFNAVLTLHQFWNEMKAEKGEGRSKISVLLPLVKIFDYPDLDLRMAHLDLKQQLHSIDYLKDHIRMLARYKINAILWEWEDKFPFKTRPELKHPLAFSHDEASELLELCKMYGIESVPLVQTFGHLEMVVKHDRYKHLNEDRDKPFDGDNTLDICPLEDETIPIIQDMIQDMISYHHKSRYFHVGGDEVYTIGTCDKCKKFVEEHGGGDKGKSKLYIYHINRIIKIVKGFGKIPMVWHDYLLKYPEYIDELDKDAVIVYWQYDRDKNPHDFEKEIQFFKEKGFKVLAGSSVRSDFQFAIPNYGTRFRNIHELHHALVANPERNIGGVATSWAVCKAPIETTVPGLLHFAESSWNVNREPYSPDVLKDVTRRALKSYFYVNPEKIDKHDTIFSLLEEATVRPQLIDDGLARVENALSDCKHAWDALGPDSKESGSVRENIIHGLKLQELKVQFYMLMNDLMKKWDDYGDESREFPKIKELREMEKSLEKLRDTFELFKFKTREVYEKVIYDDELPIEWKYRFKRPMDILEGFISMLAGVRNNIENMVESATSISEDMQSIKNAVSDDEKTTFLETLTRKIVDYDGGKDDLPFLDELANASSRVREISKHFEAASGNVLEDLANILEGAHSAIDELIFKLVMSKVQDGFVRRF